MINSVVLVGRLTKKPELRETGSNLLVCQFTLAVNRNFSGQNGRQEADFIQCVTWNKNAENLARYMDKGSLIGIEGRIQTRQYNDQSGQVRYVTEVVCDNVRFLETKNKTNDSQAFMSGYSNNYNSNSGYTQNNYSSNSNNFGSYNQNGGFNNSFNDDFSPFGNNTYETPIKEEKGFDSPFKTSVNIDIDDDDLPF